MSTPVSGPVANGVVVVSGAVGTPRLVRANGATLKNNRDGTIDLVMPAGMQPGEGIGVRWADDNGDHYTACVVPETVERTIARKLRALSAIADSAGLTSTKTEIDTVATSVEGRG